MNHDPKTETAVFAGTGAELDPPVPDEIEAPRLVLTIEDAAKRLGIGRTLMYQLLNEGKVRSVRIGRLHRIPVECLTEYVSNLLAASGGHSQPA